MPELAGYEVADTQRQVVEPIKETVRSPFARDRARVLHSSALRRLAAKTQVMLAGQSDFPRTRLTHTLEVAQIARELGASLGCDADLVEVAGLVHDLGHPPYGHNGEDALNDITKNIGGFEGNAQTLRVLTRLEAKVVDDSGASVGLNLTRASLDAGCKYPWPRRTGERKFGYYADDAASFDWLRTGAPGERTCLEEQVMDWSDDVAYSVHDVEDAVHAGLIDPAALLSSHEQAMLVTIAHTRYRPESEPAALAAAIDRLTGLPSWPSRFDGSLRSMVGLKQFTSTLIGRFSRAAQIATQIAYGDSVLTRYMADLIVPDEARDEVAVMKAMAVQYVMQRPGAEEIYAEQRAIITEVVQALLSREGRDLDALHSSAFVAADDDALRLRAVVDQVASLTDVSIVEWHQRLT
ncbi:MAG: deoxyguanosinetriphosphate triphosphohydrolase [Actinomycetales bacterium]|nr:deoxyguanosinetriphosphate triphosphohydrolase [Actinomycetales bacterium]